MKGRAFRGRKRLHMLTDLTSSAKVSGSESAAKIKKDGELQTEEEYHKSGAQQTIRRISRLKLQT